MKNTLVTCVTCARANRPWLVISDVVCRTIRSSVPWFALFSVLVVFHPITSAENARGTKSVLILYSFDKEEGIYSPVDQALRSHLRSGLHGRVEFYTEYLDLVRFSDSKHAEALAQLLKLKYEGKKLDLIIPVSYSALNFLFAGGKDLFPGVPTVALFNERRADVVTASEERLPVRRELTGVLGRDEPAATLDLALTMQPETERVAVILGSSDVEKYWLQQLQNEFSHYSKKVKLDYLTGLSMAEIAKRVSALPPHTIIFFSFFFEDSSGQAVSSEEALDLIISSANAPVYGMYSTYFDHGIVGGRVADPKQSGEELAGVAAKVLKGEQASSISMIIDSSPRNVVDWRQMRRWGISEKRLPPGTAILHKEQSLWQRYRAYILVAFLLFFFEGVLIFGLLLEGQKRRRIHKQLLRQKAFSDALVEAHPGFLLVKNRDGKNVLWNKRCEIGRFDISTCAVFDNVSAKSLGPARNAFQEVFEKGNSRAELEVLARDDKTMPVLFHATKIELEENAYAIVAGIDISELKQTQEALQVSEERFSTAFDNAPIGMALVAPDGRYIRVNYALCNMLGYSAEELQSRTYRDITYPDDVQLSENYVSRLLAGESPPNATCEKRYIHRSGRLVWGALASSSILDEKGRPVYFVSQIQDITDRKQIEDSIRTIVEGVQVDSSSEFFQSLALQVSKATGADHAFVGEFVDGDEPWIQLVGTCVNRAMAVNMFFKLQGTPYSEVIATKGVCSYSDITTRFPNDPKLPELEAQSYVGVPVIDSRGSTIGVMAALFKSRVDNLVLVGSVLQVFSKWTAAEMERSHAEERFSKAFRSSPEGCAITTLRNSLVIEANDAFLKMLGYERSEVVGKSSTEVRHWVDWNERAAIVKKIAECGSVREESVKLRTKTGKILNVRFSGEIIHIQNEPCLLGLARDVTEQSILEEKFHQSQKMEAVGMLAGGVAHDFNNLLGVIIGYSEMLSSSAAPNSPTLKKIDAIKQAAQRAAVLTTQLLAYSRKQAIQPRVSNLNSIVSETEKMLRRLIGENIQLLVLQAQKLDYVNVDPGQMVQVLMNLAINARDAISKNGKLTIETANVFVHEVERKGITPGQYVRLSVSDTGMGMSEATKARIFEPFFTTKGPGQGTGLGLATVQGIVETSGGSIWVDSKLGVGTKFEIYLPRVEDGVTAHETEAPSVKAASGPATILLVEDEVAMRMVINESLRREGYRVLAAGNGLDALRLAEQHHGPIDLLITDVIMPAMSGPEVAQALATSRPHTPVLYISGYTADKLTYYPELETDVALLQKPFKLDALTEKVQDLIGSIKATSLQE